MRDTNDAKRALRRTMRAVRREAALDPVRSATICERLAGLPALAAAHTVMVYSPVPGEPDLAAFVAERRADGAVLVVPDPHPTAVPPISPAAVDAVIVPGLAFTTEGHRLGQGGGWYDRFLAGVRPDCVTVGVCFDEQVVPHVPGELHDVPVRWMVTPRGAWATHGGT